jgi:hypothetical protein
MTTYLQGFDKEDFKLVRYYKVAFKSRIPNFTGDPKCSSPDYVVLRKTDFIGHLKIGSQVQPLGIEHYRGLHLEGCEVREIHWLSKHKGTIIGYTYIAELR